MYKFEVMNNHKFLTIPILEEYGLKNCMTTSSLDMRLNHNTENYDILMNYLNIKPLEVYQNKQNHTDNITIIDHSKLGTKASFGRVINNNDALVTKLKNVPLISLSADCTPIIIYDTKRKINANIHSGWKGTLLKIGPKTLKLMIEKYNTNPSDVLIVLNPSISFDDFEVENDVLSLFEDKLSNMEDYYKIKSSNKYNINLDQINIDNFIKMSVPKENIININISTFSNDLFHSYRRDGNDYKLMATLTSII